MHAVNYDPIIKLIFIYKKSMLIRYWQSGNIEKSEIQVDKSMYQIGEQW